MREGGLGLTDLKIKNQSLLTKWIWRFQREKSTLQRHLITAKYCSSLLPERSILKQSKGPWKNIVQQLGFIFDYVVNIIGNGESTSFWKDSWVLLKRKPSQDFMLSLTTRKHLLPFAEQRTYLMEPWFETSPK